jgi:hypothetical protein
MLLAGLLIPAGCRRDDPGQSRSGSPSADSVEKLNYFYRRGSPRFLFIPVSKYFEILNSIYGRIKGK